MNVGILNIIRLLDDTSITTINSHSGKHYLLIFFLQHYFVIFNTLSISSILLVGDLAYSLVWKCLVEDPQIFFRRFFEKITNKNKQVLYFLAVSYTHLTLPTKRIV